MQVSSGRAPRTKQKKESAVACAHGSNVGYDFWQRIERIEGKKQKGDNHMMYEERRKERGLFSLEERWLKMGRNLTAAFDYLRRDYRGDGTRHVHRKRT